MSFCLFFLLAHQQHRRIKRCRRAAMPSSPPPSQPMKKEAGYVGLNWKDHVEIHPRYFRLSEVDNLRGSAQKAKKALGWEPKMIFKQVVAMMVEGDLERAKREKML